MKSADMLPPVGEERDRKKEGARNLRPARARVNPPSHSFCPPYYPAYPPLHRVVTSTVKENQLVYLFSPSYLIFIPIPTSLTHSVFLL